MRQPRCCSVPKMIRFCDQPILLVQASEPEIAGLIFEAAATRAQPTAAWCFERALLPIAFVARLKSQLA